MDAKEAWERQQAAQKQRSPVSKPPTDKGKWWELSPVLESEKRQSINFCAEKEAADDSVLDSHERNEKGAMRQYLIDKKLAGPRAKMIDDARIIYKDLIAELEKSKKK